MPYLNDIHSSEDIRKLTFPQLNSLAEEIRTFLIEKVSVTGGHLASNLGAVEITIAIHNVFNSEKDRILFDVGHQSYVHKILTGRANEFDGLRHLNGISGFPKPEESTHDAFTAGHASTAVSTALGIARARTMQGEDYNVVAVVGDGATSGGVFFEGMNDAGASKEPLIVILNDNGMSISKNVGGLARHLSRLRMKPEYFGLKKAYRKFTKAIPGGKYLYGFTHSLKAWVRRSILGTTIFEQMGFEYYGPVDGHDIQKLSYLLERAKEERKPVLIHAITVKGKGYGPAEQNPDAFHGVGPFNAKTGEIPTGKSNFSKVFGETLTELAGENKNVCAVCAGMVSGTGLRGFQNCYPERLYDVGIAEEHAVSMSAGLAKQGMVPVFAVYSTFLQRSFDMLMQDVALQQLHVVFGVDRAGLVGEDGETHQGIFDVGMLRQIPGMRIFAPVDYKELRFMLRTAIVECKGPVAVRYPRGVECEYVFSEQYLMQPAKIQRLTCGTDITMVSYGINMTDVLTAADRLRVLGYSPETICMKELSGFEFGEITDSVRKTGRLIVVEEQTEDGSIGEAVLAAVGRSGISAKTCALNAGSRFVKQGSPAQLRALLGIDSEGVYKKAMELLS